MTAPANPSAFPCAPGDVAYWSEGMTLRDWFAGQALVGIGVWSPEGVDYRIPGHVLDERAKWAFKQADAMLAARSEQPK